MNYAEHKKLRYRQRRRACGSRCLFPAAPTTVKTASSRKHWDFNYGEPFTPAVEEKLIEMLRPGFINGLTLLGGEPMEPQNQRALLPFLRRVRKELPEKTIWAFSGFTWEELNTPGSHSCCETTPELLSLLDVLVDGRFVQALYDISLRFRGSSNQRIIDVPKTLQSGSIVLWQD